MWRCKGQRRRDGLLAFGWAPHVTDDHLIWFSGPLPRPRSSPARSVGDRRLSAAEVGAQCQVYLRMWREAVDIGCWESLCGWRHTEDPELVSYEHNGKFAAALCLLWFNFKAACGKNLRKSQRAYCVLHPCSMRRSHAHVLPACVRAHFGAFICVFQRFRVW